MRQCTFSSESSCPQAVSGRTTARKLHSRLGTQVASEQGNGILDIRQTASVVMWEHVHSAVETEWEQSSTCHWTENTMNQRLWGAHNSCTAKENQTQRGVFIQWESFADAVYPGAGSWPLICWVIESRSWLQILLPPSQVITGMLLCPADIYLEDDPLLCLEFYSEYLMPVL